MFAKLLGRAYTAPEEEAYQRLARKGYKPASIIDVGAYEGNWTRLARSVFPGTPAMMVEAQPAKLPILQTVVSELPQVRLESAVLSGTRGEEITFFAMETGSSMMPERSNVDREQLTLKTETLDHLAQDIKGPIFLKIDVQGAELKVLSGGEETLKRCDLVQLEIAVLHYNEGAPTFLEVIQYMDDHGFVPYDLSGSSRPNGVDLVQVDWLFVRRDSELRTEFFQF